MTNVTEKLDFNFCLIVINLDLSLNIQMQLLY